MMRLPLTAEWLVVAARLSPELLATTSVERAVLEQARAVQRRRGWSDGDLDREYATLLTRDRAEAAALRAVVAVPESWLFRGRASFEFLREWLAERRKGIAQGVTMLSAGCAGGAEAMSMALTALAAGLEPHQVSIDAVDVNAAALDGAQDGVYAGLALRDEVPAWATAVSVDSERRVRIPASVRAMVRFERSDLFAWDPGEGRYDVLFCRNVLIYLERTARAELIARLRSWLRPGGLLVLGHAEAGDAPADFRTMGSLDAFAFAFERGAPVRTPLLPPPRKERRPTQRRVVEATGVGPAAASRSHAPSASLRAPSTIELCRRLIAETQWDAAEKALRDVVRREPARVEGHVLLAEMHLRRERPREAEESLRRAVYLDPQCEAALITLSQLAERAGNRPLADRYRERALAAHLRQDASAEPH